MNYVFKAEQEQNSKDFARGRGSLNQKLKCIFEKMSYLSGVLRITVHLEVVINGDLEAELQAAGQFL